MNPMLVIPSMTPQASTDMRLNPYGSMSAMNTPPRKLLKVLNSSSAIRPGTIRTARSAPDDVDESRIIMGGLGCFLRDVDAHEMDQRAGGQDDRDRQRGAHAEQTDRQAAEHRGDRERHAVRRADEPVRLVALILRHQEGDGRRQRHRAQVADDGAREDQRDQCPEREMTEVLQRTSGCQGIHGAGGQERDQGKGVGEQHRGLA